MRFAFERSFKSLKIRHFGIEFWQRTESGVPEIKKNLLLNSLAEPAPSSLQISPSGDSSRCRLPAATNSIYNSRIRGARAREW